MKIKEFNPSEQFNELTPAQSERLYLVMEEAAEVIQMIGKILRHGYWSFNPYDPDKVANRDLLAKELGDLMAVVELLTDTGDVDAEKVSQAKDLKPSKMYHYLHHNTLGVAPQEEG